MAISQALLMVGLVEHGMRQSAEVIAQMTAVERVLNYTELPQEEPLESIEYLPPEWPAEGQIIMKNVTMKYSEHNPPVLKVF